LVRLLIKRTGMTITVAEQRKQNIMDAVRDYGKRLFYFIRGRVESEEDAEDILQDVWYQFSGVVNTEPIEQVSAWLFRVARNRIVDKYRKKEFLPLDEGEEEDRDEIFFQEAWTPENKELGEIFWDKLFASLEELPEEQRQVFIWHELDEIPFQEIALRTGEKIPTLISRKRYAVLYLRKQLEELYHQIIEP
jgi:RNA polymerase sigma factor (sigma-70 family)